MKEEEETELQELSKSATHWHAAYLTEAKKCVAIMSFLEHYTGEDWPMTQKAIRAHLMSTEL